MTLQHSKGYHVGEGKQSQVVLLDGRRLDILIQPKLYTAELLDMVSSHLNLKEKEYFGLAFLDDSGHYSWLQMDRKVVEHQFPKKYSSGPQVFYFMVKFFVESISQLRDNATIEMFYQQAKLLVFQGVIEPDSETVFSLAALVLQEVSGDYSDDQTTRERLKDLPVLPTRVLKTRPSLHVCEDKVSKIYKNLKGTCRGSAIVKYMKIVESFPAYGVHYYEVKDKGGFLWWIGLNYKGIGQYDYIDRKTPRKLFPWEKLENVYFKQRKFSVEVHKRRRIQTTRRPLGPGKLIVYTWFASAASLAKTIWLMAVAQHQFHLDCSHGRSPINSLRNYEEIACELSGSIMSSSSTPSLRTSKSSPSLSVFKREGLNGVIEHTNSDQHDLMAALKARKEDLEEALRHKMEELKLICIREAELTGEVPLDIPLAPGEEPPRVRRRVGTSFVLNDKLFHKARSKKEEALTKVELEYEIQSKITSAALKLASDTTVKRNVRKQRKTAHQRALIKLKDLEQKLSTLKKQTEIMKANQRKPSSDGEPSEDSMSHSTDENGDKSFLSDENDLCGVNSQLQTKPNEKKNLLNKEYSVSRSPSTPSSSSSLRHSLSSAGVPKSPCSAPSSPTKYRQPTQEQRRRCSVSLPRSPFQIPGGRRILVQTFNEQHKAHILSQVKTSPVARKLSKLHSSGSPSTCSDYETVSSEGGSAMSLQTSLNCPRFGLPIDTEISNLYNVSSQRTSTVFDSQDDLFTFSVRNNDEKNSLVDDGFSESQPGLPDHPNRSRCFSLDFSSHSNSRKKLLNVPREIEKHRKYSESFVGSAFKAWDRNVEDQLSNTCSPCVLSANTSSKENDTFHSPGKNKDQNSCKNQCNSENKRLKTVKIIPKIVFSTSKEKLTVDEMNNSKRDHPLLINQNALCNKGDFNKDSPHNNNLNYFINTKKLVSGNQLTFDQSTVPECSSLVPSFKPSSNSAPDNKSQNISVDKKHSLHISFLDQRRGSNIYSSPGNLTNRRKGSFTSQKETALRGINRSAEMKSLLSFWSSLNSATNNCPINNQHLSCNVSVNQLQSSNTFTYQHSSLNSQTNQHKSQKSSTNQYTSQKSSTNQHTSQKSSTNQHTSHNSSTNQHTSHNSSPNQQSMLRLSNNQNSPLQEMQSSYFHSNSRINQKSACLLPTKRIILNTSLPSCTLTSNTKLENGGQSPTCRSNASIERNCSHSDLEKARRIVTESSRTLSDRNSKKTLKSFTASFETPQSKAFTSGKSSNLGFVRKPPAKPSNQPQEVPNITISSPDEEVRRLSEERSLDIQSLLEFGGSTNSRSLAEDFHQEMIAWYENHQGVKKATFV